MNLSQLTPSVTALEGGLDLANPKHATTPGTLSDCLNVEVAERVGYKSIDGLERHDGRLGPSIGQSSEMVTFASLNTLDLVVGDTIGVVGQAGDWATVVSIRSPTGASPSLDHFSAYVHGDQNVLLDTTNTISLVNTRTSTTFSARPLVRADLVSNDTPAEQAIKFYNDVYDDINQTVTTIPNGSRAHGLHWFRDRLYAVANMVEYKFTNGNYEVLPNMKIEDSDGNYAIVRDVVVTDGSWDDGDAVGFLYTTSENVAVGNVDFVEGDPETTVESDVLTITERSSQDKSQKAQLWRTTEQEFVLDGTQTPDGTDAYGWNPIDMGYVVNFKDGSYIADQLPSINRKNVDDPAASSPVVSSTDENDTDSAPQGLDRGDNIPGLPANVAGSSAIMFESGTVPTDVESHDSNYLQYGPNSAITVSNSPIIWTQYAREFTDFTQVAAMLPDDALIQGIEFILGAYIDVGPGDTLPNPLHQVYIRMKGSSTEEPNKLITISPTATDPSNPVLYTVGGPEDTWGRDDLSKAVLNDPDFGFDFRPLIAANGGEPIGSVTYDRRLRFDTVKIKVYYSSANARLYFWDGTSDVTALLTTSWVTKGSFTGNNAQGVMQVTSLETDGVNDRVHIKPGDEIWSMPGGNGFKLGVVDGPPSHASLPSLGEIVNKRSRYQFITANFYANEAWDAMYGVSGAGRAFVYDQYYFRYIYTGLDDAMDTPRHIEFHIYHLALGYASGSVLLSSAGNPEDFMGVNGASEWATGDPITGLLSLPGTMLGIGCQRSMWGLAGESIQNFELQTLRPKEGCVEYTFIDCGAPIYCSNTGVSIFSTTPAYGDFIQEKLSYNVYPFLYPRLNKRVNRTVGPRAASIVCAVPVRKKGQALLFFEDGYCLSVTLAGSQKPPSFTLRRYAIKSTSEDVYGESSWLVPIANTTENDSLGRERVFISHYGISNPSGNTNDNLKYVFEVDKGWSFAGQGFEWFFSTNFDFAKEAKKTPADEATSRALKLYGMSYGYSQVGARLGNAYREIGPAKYDVSIPPPYKQGERVINLQYDLYPYYSNIQHTAMEGELFTMIVSNDSPKMGSPFDILPPSIFQVVLKEFDSGKEGA